MTPITDDRPIKTQTGKVTSLLACFSDTFTKQGVQMFYSEPVWAVAGTNPRRRLKTGGAGELWVLGIAIARLKGQYAVGTVEVKLVQ